jgi:lipopolysaccharide transport system ATP-binding protein
LLEIGTGFNPDLSGRENVYLNGSFLGMKTSEIRQKFDEIVAFSEVEQFIDTPVKYYSSGMFVRLAFSVAVHLTPEVLLLDEVLSVGDAGFQHKSMEKMKELLGGGATIILVSHNAQAIREICKRAIWLEKGMVQEESSAANVAENYSKFLEGLTN